MSAAIKVQRDALLAAARKVEQIERTTSTLEEFDAAFDAALVELRDAIAQVERSAS